MLEFLSFTCVSDFVTSPLVPFYIVLEAVLKFQDFDDCVVNVSTFGNSAGCNLSFVLQRIIDVL